MSKCFFDKHLPPKAVEAKEAWCFLKLNQLYSIMVKTNPYNYPTRPQIAWPVYLQRVNEGRL